MGLGGRKYQANANANYRYGQNSQERDRELNENIYTAEYWEYDARLGRRWNVDPKVDYSNSSYSTFLNNPIWIIDVKGDKGDTINVMDKNRNVLMKLDDGKKEITELTVKELYEKKVQWFEPNAENYMKPLSTNENISKLPGIKHFTWGQIIAFADEHPMTYSYCEGCSGDWKQSKEGGQGYLLTTVNDKLYWTDAVGQIPFAYTAYKRTLEGTVNNSNSSSLPYESRVKSIALTQAWNMKMAFALVKEYGNGNPFSPVADNAKSYDNFMALRGIQFAAQKFLISVGRTHIMIKTNEHVTTEALKNSISSSVVNHFY